MNLYDEMITKFRMPFKGGYPEGKKAAAHVESVISEFKRFDQWQTRNMIKAFDGAH